MLRLTYELTLHKDTSEFARVGFDGMSADGSGFDTFAGTDVSFAFVAFAGVSPYLFGAFDGEAVVVRTGVGDIGADDGVVGTDMDLADASFEASAFY